MTQTTPQFSPFLTRMRARAPLVQNITNFVAMNVQANVMLAAGASPAMAHALEEGAEFAGFAGALTVNIGTFDDSWSQAMLSAVRGANAAGTPWVLDPVACGATQARRDLSARLLALAPAVIRGNASEILALSGTATRGKGADSADEVDAAMAGATTLARRSGAVVAVTGPTDFITDGTAGYWVDNGSAMMPRVTALGCSLTGIIGAFIAQETDRLRATTAALTYYACAGEQAAQNAAGPGSFAVAFIDALYTMTAAQMDQAARVRKL
ncbi:hydroxyethylthiazole kinase [Thioclava sp. SK-1]|uniref:hydroxyethylthiazole kinase n=1 Tax=Thioclava sp. SK-1 TaxID=1889770 RepID=UPI000826A5A5|nr:hydroxyethylthiazole kinase [Thioclava sp. SK-1]OCX66100.1 hydroxyethylthiazole kinase [Thioclava sp. SK-1]